MFRYVEQYPTVGSTNVDQQFTADQVARALGVPDAHYLGTGSYGETWRVVRSGRDEAVKIIHVDGYDEERLRREIEGYRRVSSPHVVGLLDVQVIEVAGQSRAAMTFQYVPGGDLQQALLGSRAEEDELRGLAVGLLLGVDALHTADLLHRDLKPANIALLDGDFARPVILDLGLTKLLDVESMTNYPSRIGTPLYMAPEQLRQERALRASDLWAVAVVLYEASTGRHPYLSPSEFVTFDELLARMQTPPGDMDGIPSDVARLITKCLSPQPYRRGTVRKAIEMLS